MNPLEQSKTALSMLKEAIIETLKQNPGGMGNSDIARALHLESDFEGSQKNYLSWSVIGLLVNEGRVEYKKIGNRKYYSLAKPHN